MKYLLILLLLVASCSKRNSTCFTCSFGNVNGNQYPDRKVCTDGEYPDLGEVVDENGNELGYYCEKR